MSLEVCRTSAQTQPCLHPGLGPAILDARHAPVVTLRGTNDSHTALTTRGRPQRGAHRHTQRHCEATANLERTGKAGRAPGLLPPKHVPQTSQFVSRLFPLHPTDCANAAARGARGRAGRRASASGSWRFYFGSGRGRREGCGRGGEGNPKLKYPSVMRMFSGIGFSHQQQSVITFAFARWRRVQLPRISPSQAVRPNAPRGVRTQAAGPGRGARAGLTGFGRGGLHPRGVAPGSPGEG